MPNDNEKIEIFFRYLYIGQTFMIIKYIKYL